jgi:hypothetical protein
MFYTPGSEEEYLYVLSNAHVVLDPYPASGGLLPSLQALALPVPVPVLTMPSDRLAGRFTLALYQMLNYGLGSFDSDSSTKQGVNSESSTKHGGNSESSTKNGVNSGSTDGTHSGGGSGGALVVRTPSEYIATALLIAHNAKLRAQHTTELAARRWRLFHNEEQHWAAVEDWRRFLFSAVAKERKRRASQT